MLLHQLFDLGAYVHLSKAKKQQQELSSK